MTKAPPSPEKLQAMTTRFYEAALDDDLIGKMFSRAATDHAVHLASWLSVVFGGPRDYLRERGDLSFVMYKHMNLKITEEQRARWARLMMDAAAETFTDEAFLRQYARFVHSITHNVREISNLPTDEVRRMIGLAPSEDMRPAAENQP
ncbi:MAG: globin [Pseudomonadota bacterium]